MKNNKRLSIVSIILTILMVTVFMAGCEIDEIPNTATPDEKYISSTTAEKATAASEVSSSESVSEAASEKSSATETQDKNNTKATEANTGKTTTTSPTEKNSNNTGNNNSTSSKPSSGSSGSGSSTSSKPSGGNSTSSNSGGSSSSSKPSDSGNSGNSGGNSSTPSKPNSGGSGSSTSSKTWHEAEYEYIEHPAEYQDVWVVDQEAYSYEEPVYETKSRTFCNQCGEDITYNLDEHMIANEGSCWSYRNKPVKVQTGTRTVDVPEKGHWEKQKVKDAWTEKRLVREAGYY